MIVDNERLVIIVGMAHSGTTILAHVLQQHPKICCCSNGTESWVFENTWLPTEQSEPIQLLLARFPNQMILLKRPWNEVWHGEWMSREMPNARFIYCWRDFEDIVISWSKQSSMVDYKLRNGSIPYKKNFYNMCKNAADKFGKTVANFYTHYHQDFLDSPQRVIGEITKWLCLQPWNFNVSLVNKNIDIKNVIRGRR